ncbi:TPA: hypothetical protein ACH3X2_010672 [Trebouxia sp. C0005]
MLTVPCWPWGVLPQECTLSAQWQQRLQQAPPAQYAQGAPARPGNHYQLSARQAIMPSQRQSRQDPAGQLPLIPEAEDSYVEEFCVRELDQQSWHAEGHICVCRKHDVPVYINS